MGIPIYPELKSGPGEPNYNPFASLPDLPKNRPSTQGEQPDDAVGGIRGAVSGLGGMVGGFLGGEKMVLVCS